jgi:hypothetical protein
MLKIYLVRAGLASPPLLFRQPFSLSGKLDIFLELAGAAKRGRKGVDS